MTWQEYATALEDRLEDLHGRVHRGAYQAQPSKRCWIPKSNGSNGHWESRRSRIKLSNRPRCRSSTRYTKRIFGGAPRFRPGRSQHIALDALYVAIKRKRVNWILDLDLKSFFDTIPHEKLVQFVEKRIADPRVRA